MGKTAVSPFYMQDDVHRGSNEGDKSIFEFCGGKWMIALGSRGVVLALSLWVSCGITLCCIVCERVTPELPGCTWRPAKQGWYQRSLGLVLLGWVRPCVFSLVISKAWVNRKLINILELCVGKGHVISSCPNSSSTDTWILLWVLLNTSYVQMRILW